jgi:hypothetical protein
MDDCLACSCIPDSHPYRVTSTKCRIDTVVSPDNGHIVARNMDRKEINILRKIVHHVGFIYRKFHSFTPQFSIRSAHNQAQSVIHLQ